MRRFYILIFTIFTITGILANDNKTTSNGFTWGGDVGTTIDFSNNGMSTIDADVNVGYKNNFFRSLCVGAGMHNTLSNGDRFIPVYLLIRTSFTSRPKQFCFGEVKVGYSFNSIESETQQGLYCPGGVGFNLYSNNKFKSHLVIAYNFYQTTESKKLKHLEDMHSVGINF